MRKAFRSRALQARQTQNPIATRLHASTPSPPPHKRDLLGTGTSILHRQAGIFGGVCSETLWLTDMDVYKSFPTTF